MKRSIKLTIATSAALFGAFVGVAIHAQSAQDKYSLKSPSGIAFADFKGYEDWAVVSSARTGPVSRDTSQPEHLIVSGRRAGVRPGVHRMPTSGVA